VPASIKKSFRSRERRFGGFKRGSQWKSWGNDQIAEGGEGYTEHGKERGKKYQGSNHNMRSLGYKAKNILKENFSGGEKVEEKTGYLFCERIVNLWRVPKR